MSDKIKDTFPTTIDRPMLFLLWEIDEFMLFLIPVIFTLPMRKLIFGIIIGVFLMFSYIKIKKNNPDNYFFHLGWNNGVVDIKNLPKPYFKKMKE